MSMEQETLIYVEENDKSEARVLAQSFAKKEVKSRAYINALGAELGMKYLSLESINSSRLYNMHSIHKVIEEFDISDIMLNNIHIDVRVVFDENYIFVPKSHFEYNITPDIYLVLLLSENHSHAAFLGFFEPKLINKNNQNSQYYFIEKEKLTAPSHLKAFIEGFKGNTTHSLSGAENEKAEMLMLSMADQNISVEETKELLSMLQKSADLRDKFIEFENFELLAYKAEHCPDIKIPENNVSDEVLDTTIDDLTGNAEDEEKVIQGGISVDMPAQEPAEENVSDLPLEGLDEAVAELSEEILSENVAGLSEGPETELQMPDVEALAEDVAGGLAAAGLASAAELGTDILSAGAAALETASINENSAGLLEESAEPLSGEELSLSEMPNLEDNAGSVIEDLPPLDENMLSADLLAESLSEFEPGSNEIENVQAGVELGELSQADNISSDAPSEFQGSSMEQNSEMADMDQLASNTGTSSFDEASLDDLMSDSSLDDSSELSSIEALQEENARKKGLLPSLDDDDDALLENSLDFSKVKSQPQVDMNNLNSNLETVDISGFDAIAPEVRLEEVSLDDTGVLDISDVNAIPNNFGDNISETVELNNFSVVDNTCENQTNIQKTAPTANFGNLGGFEPLDTGDMFISDTVEPDNMTLSMDTKPAPKRPATPSEVDLSGFESLDMEPFHVVPTPSPKKDISFAQPKDDDDLAAALLGGVDVSRLSIANLDGTRSSFFDEKPADLNPLPQKEEHVDGSLGVEPPGQPEMLSFDMELPPSKPAAPAEQDSKNEIGIADELSVDDIVDSPDESNVDVDLISQAVDLDVANDSLFDDSLNMSENNGQQNSAVQQEDNLVMADDLDNMPIVEDDSVSSQAVPAQAVQGAVAAQIQQAVQTAAVKDENTIEEGTLDELEALGTPMDSTYSDSDNEDLTMLFNDSLGSGVADAVSGAGNETGGFVPSLPHLPERQGGGKGKIIGAAVLVALLAAGTFFGLNMKNKNELSEVEALSQPVPENNEPQIPATPPIQENNENLMANAPEVIDMPQNQAEPKNVKPAEPAVKNVKDTKAAASAKPVNPEGAIMSVKKLSWELPDYLSYSQEMKKYLQTAGKSIKLTLTSDLLLASEYAYSNKVKVSLKLSNDGTIQDAKVVTSSGSDEIDKIVLQTVKETMNVVKPAPGEVPTPDFNLGLIINF